MKKLILAIFFILYSQTACQSASSPFRVVALLPTTAVDTAASQSMVESLLKLERESEVTDINFTYILRQNISADTLGAEIDQLLTNSYDLIIAHHPAFEAAVISAAQSHPEQSFALWSSTASPQENLFVYDVEGAGVGYVNGRLAASLSENQHLSIISTSNSPDMGPYIEGFRLGATTFNPHIQLNVVQTELPTAVSATLAQIEAGADVFSGNIPDALQTVIENELFWLGIYTDQRELSTEWLVVSQVYDWTVALDEFLYFMREENKRGGESYTLTLENSGVLMRYSERYADTPIRQFGDEGLFDVIDGLVDLP